MSARPLPPYQDLLSLPAAVVIGVGACLTVAVAGLPSVGLALGSVGVAVLYAVYPLAALRWGIPRERAT